MDLLELYVEYGVDLKPIDENIGNFNRYNHNIDRLNIKLYESLDDYTLTMNAKRPDGSVNIIGYTLTKIDATNYQLILDDWLTAYEGLVEFALVATKTSQVITFGKFYVDCIDTIQATSVATPSDPTFLDKVDKDLSSYADVVLADETEARLYVDDDGTPSQITMEALVDKAQQDIPFISFENPSTHTPLLEGEVAWNETQGTLDIGMKGGNVTQQVGMEMLIRCRNDDTVTLTDGMVVYSAGTVGASGVIRVLRASASNEEVAGRVIGVVTETILANGIGYVTCMGEVNDVNTATMTAEATLYLGENGALTEVIPTAPTKKIIVGRVMRVASNGSIYVRLQKGYSMKELDDVVQNGTATGGILVYNATAGTWGTGDVTFTEADNDLYIGTPLDKIILNKATEVNGNFNVKGLITQDGSAYETHLEQLYTEKDQIILRDGAVSGLGVGSYAGLFAKLADGTNNSGLVFDGNGMARVGDIGTDLATPVFTNTQALATREDTPIANAIPRWNASAYRFDTDNGITTNPLGVNNVMLSFNALTAQAANFMDFAVNSVNKASLSALGLFSGLDYYSSTNKANLGNIWVDSKHNGVPESEKSKWSLSYNATSRIFTLTLSSASYYYVGGVRYDLSVGSHTWTLHANTYGEYFFYFDNTGTKITSAVNEIWDIENSAQVAYVIYNPLNLGTTPAGLLAYEIHGQVMSAGTHKNLHIVNGTKLITSGTLADYSASDINFSITESTIADEDIYMTIPAQGQTTYALLYANASNQLNFTTGSIPIFKSVGNNIQYNEIGVGLTEITTNDTYVNYYVIVAPMNANAERTFMLPGQATYATKALAEAETPGNLSLTALSFQEMAFLYRITYKRTNGGVEANGRAEIVSATKIKPQDTKVTALVGDHSLLTNRNLADQHTISSITDLTTQLAAKAPLIEPTFTNNAIGDIPVIVDAIAGTTGNLQQWSIGGTLKARISVEGAFRGYGIRNNTSVNNSEILAGENGTVIYRNIADANPALKVQNSHTDSTGYIAEFWSNVGGTTARRMYIAKDGRIYTPNGIYNIANDSNARVLVETNGALISRNIADANAALTVNQVHASSTGNILNLQFGGVNKATIDKDGMGSFLGGILEPTFKNNAVGDVVAIVNAMTGQTANLLSLQVAGVEKAYVNKDGYLGLGLIQFNSALVTSTAKTVTIQNMAGYMALELPPLKDTVASTWSADATYSGFGYRSTITATGVSTGDIAEITFAHDQAISGNYSPVCETGTNLIYIYSKVNTSITIPTITIKRVV